MADTIREKILDNIKITLEKIKTYSGYDNSIASVQRWEQDGNDLTQVPCIIVNAGFEEKENRPGLITSCRFSVFIDIWLRHDKVSKPGSTDTLINSLLADVEKALMVDYTRGGYAVATRINNNVPFETTQGQPYAGAIIECEIEYRHSTGDPTQQM